MTTPSPPPTAPRSRCGTATTAPTSNGPSSLTAPCRCTASAWTSAAPTTATAAGSSYGPATAAPTSKGTPPTASWSTPPPANASTTPAPTPPTAPSSTCTPAPAAPTSNGPSPDPSAKPRRENHSAHRPRLQRRAHLAAAGLDQTRLGDRAEHRRPRHQPGLHPPLTSGTEDERNPSRHIAEAHHSRRGGTAGAGLVRLGRGRRRVRRDPDDAVCLADGVGLGLLAVGPVQPGRGAGRGQDHELLDDRGHRGTADGRHIPAVQHVPVRAAGLGDQWPH